MPLLIKDGRVITATRDLRADVCCADHSITRLEPSIDPRECPPGTTVIDAANKYVFPGFIDPHVHIHLPFMGTHAKDTWESASRAALVGGTTTLIEMVCPGKGDDPLEAFELWRGKAVGHSSCDFSFHMGVTRFDEGVEQALRKIAASQIRSFKVFLAYRGAFGVDDRELYRTLKLARELGVVVTAHCENETLIAERQAELLAAGKKGPGFHEPSRPTRVEASGVQHLMNFAEMTGAEVYIVHTSCDEAIAEVRAGIARGVRAHIETVIPYLTLDSSYAERAGDNGFEGAKWVMSPPIRAKKHQDVLWNALRDRTISTVATDHAPFDYVGQKEMGRPPESDFTRIPNGIPSVEHRVDLLFTHGVATGRIDLHTFVDAASTRAAKIFGLEGKGDIAVGYDADLVVYDPNHRGVVSSSTHHMLTDYSAWEGWETVGRAEFVSVRGRPMVFAGKLIAEKGWGRLVPRR